MTPINGKNYTLDKKHYRTSQSPSLKAPTHSLIKERELINSIKHEPSANIIKLYENYLKQQDSGSKKDPAMERVLRTALQENVTNILKNDDLELYKQRFDNIKLPFDERIKNHQNAIKAIKRQGQLLPTDKENIRKKNIEIFKLTAMHTALKNIPQYKAT
jgi:hypothetical protein